MFLHAAFSLRVAECELAYAGRRAHFQRESGSQKCVLDMHSAAGDSVRWSSGGGPGITGAPILEADEALCPTSSCK